MPEESKQQSHSFMVSAFFKFLLGFSPRIPFDDGLETVK